MHYASKNIKLYDLYKKKLISKYQVPSHVDLALTNRVYKVILPIFTLQIQINLYRGCMGD